MTWPTARPSLSYARSSFVSGARESLSNLLVESQSTHADRGEGAIAGIGPLTRAVGVSVVAPIAGSCYARPGVKESKCIGETPSPFARASMVPRFTSWPPFSTWAIHG